MFEFLVILMVLCILQFRSNLSQKVISVGVPGDSTTDGIGLSFNISYGESVGGVMKNICRNKIEEDLCSSYSASLSRILYGILYTPSRNSSIIEDYTTRRYDIISTMKSKFKLSKYLEIGCYERSTFDLVSPGMTIAYCVDPAFGGTHAVTSDEFFASNEETFDLIFIDGLHSAAQVMRDIQNSLRWLSYDGFIILHDCNPQREYEQRFPRPMPESEVWNGDVWKAAVMLRLQDGLEIVVADVDHGVGIVRRKFNRNRLPQEWETRLVTGGVGSLEWTDLSSHRETLLRLMTLKEVWEWLESP